QLFLIAQPPLLWRRGLAQLTTRGLSYDLARVTARIGTVRTRTPVASKMAFPSAAATGAVAASPAPSGGSFGLSINATSTAGASGKVRIGYVAQFTLVTRD